MSHPTILLIEDNLEMSQNIEEILQLAHFSVICAPDGKKGVELALQERPDLILCDIMMPELDGYGVLHILSRDPETADIPFVFLTARAEKEDFRMAMNLGATDYITKPFDDLDLLRVVEVRLKKRDSIKHKFSHAGGAGQELHWQKLSRVKGFQELLEAATPRHYKKKQFVYVAGEQPHELFFLESGEIKTFMSNKEGKELITGFRLSGSFLGYASLFNGTPYSDTAQVVSKTVQLRAIGRQEFLDVIFSNNELSLHFIHILSQQLSENEQRMLELAYFSVRQKVAGVLLHMNAQADIFCNSRGAITASRKDISCMVGTATETLNRTLLDFKDEKLIDICEEGILLLNLHRLRRLHE